MLYLTKTISLMITVALTVDAGTSELCSPPSFLDRAQAVVDPEGEIAAEGMEV